MQLPPPPTPLWNYKNPPSPQRKMAAFNTGPECASLGRKCFRKAKILLHKQKKITFKAHPTSLYIIFHYGKQVR